MRRRISQIVFLLVACAALARAQDRLRELEVATLRFDGNETFHDDALLAVMQTKESPAGFWQFLFKISEKLGDKPEFFDPVAFDLDFARLRDFYQNQGFYKAHIDTSLRIQSDRKTIDLCISIREGPRSLIDTIQYVGFDDLPSDLQEEIKSRPLIQVGDPFVIERVANERARIVNAFFDNGFADVHVDSVVGHRYTSSNNFTLIVAISRGKRFLFGDIAIREDTTVTGNVDDDVIRQHLDFKKGDFYSKAKQSESERNLNRLGVFETSRIEPIVAMKTDTSQEIPMQIYVRPRPFQEIVPEIGVNDENNAFNVLLGLGYNHRNFAGGARNFEAKSQVQIQSIQDVEFSRVFKGTGLRDSSVIGNAELTFQINQPFFINNKTSFTPSLSFIVDKRNKYYFNPIIRARFAVTSQTARYTTVFLDWSLERIGYEPINATIGALYFDSLSIDRRPQFNSIIAATLQRDKRNDVFFPSAGFFHSMTFEEAGIIPSIFGGLFGLDLPYSKYVKLSSRGNWYWDPSGVQDAVLALRLYGGVSVLYGNSPAPVPITRRFFGGGSGSVRGWRARELSASRFPEEGGNTVFEASVEDRWNLLKNAGRLAFLEFNKFSLVFFYDIGNVWPTVEHVRFTDLAMASGMGLRYATIAGPVRVDFGFRVYDPSDVPERRWITQKKFYKETLGNFVLHFGIGHAF
jgi:outer membrane protein insertion porin family